MNTNKLKKAVAEQPYFLRAVAQCNGLASLREAARMVACGQRGSWSLAGDALRSRRNRAGRKAIARAMAAHVPSGVLLHRYAVREVIAMGTKSPRPNKVWLQ